MINGWALLSLFLGIVVTVGVLGYYGSVKQDWIAECVVSHGPEKAGVRDYCVARWRLQE